MHFFLSPQSPERTQMFVTSRLLEMGFSMRHIYWAMEAAGTALCSVSDATTFLLHVLYLLNSCPFTECFNLPVVSKIG